VRGRSEESSPAPKSTEAGDQGARRWFWPATVLVAVLTAGYAGALVVLPPAAAPGFAALFLAVSQVAAVPVLVWRARREAGRARRVWMLLAGSAFSSALIFVVWSYFRLVRGQATLIPSLADLAYLTSIVLIVPALLSVPGNRLQTRERLRFILDGCIVAASTVMISWATVLGPALHARPSGLLRPLLLLSYPVGDVIGITLAILVAMRVRPGTRVSVLLIAAGVIALCLGDSAFTYLTLEGRDATGGLATVAWVPGYLLMALAALRGPLGNTRVPAGDKRLSAFLPNVPAVVAIAVGLANKPGPVLLTTGLVLIVLLFARQTLAVSAEAKLAKELAAREARWRSLIQNSSDVHSVVDAMGFIAYQSPAAERFGYDAGQLSGQVWFDRFLPDEEANLRELLAGVAAVPGGSAILETTVLDAAGERRPVEVILTNLLTDPDVAGVVINMREITERKVLEGQMHHQAFHDSLTGLANRALFYDRVTHALDVVERDGKPVTVVFLDLDEFKEVNDNLGHTAGDELLKEVARRLTACTRPTDIVARLGGDEFAVLLTDAADARAAEAASRRILDALAEPWRLGGREVVIEASIGIALSGLVATDVHDLLRNADTAMYVVKRGGKNGYVTFTPEMARMALARNDLIADLRLALERREITAHYQPKFLLATGELTGYEALIRWTHPIRGNVPPIEFIPLAEQVGIINDLGMFVLQEACRQLIAWQDQGAGSLTMAVNLSASQLAEPDLVGSIARVIAETGVSSSSIELELTETAIMGDLEAAIPVLVALKGLGVSLAIDDFGTGHSSLNYLKEFPVDSLKIDRAFVSGLGRNDHDSALVAAFIAMARALQMSSVAEGIETFEQLVELRALGCEQAQGYFLSRPGPSEAVQPMLFGAAHAVSGRSRIHTVLVCDDDPLVRLAFGAAFTSEGTGVVEAADGAECLRLAELVQPDLVILDIQIPDFAGATALAELRARAPQCLVMIVTSTPLEHLVRDASDLGADAVFVKDGFAPLVTHLLAEESRLPRRAAIEGRPVPPVAAAR